MSLQHWMSFSTFKEQNYFRFPNTETYDGVIFNGNMVAHAPAGLAAFLIEKTRLNIPYIIDPVTHAFQHDVKFIKNVNGEIKSSISNMASYYGRIISENAGIRPLTGGDFEEGEDKIDLVTNCLNFQRNILTEAIKENDSLKYLGDIGESYTPHALASPYFFFDDTSIDEWLQVNIDLAKLAIESKLEGEKIFIPIVIGSEILLDEELIDRIVDSFDGMENDGFLFWISNFDEGSVGTSYLRSMLKLSTGLRKGSTKELINLHGGYFSILSSSPVFTEPSFSAVAHGPEFGEFRDVIPVGGGIPISRYYVHQLHSRIRYRDALQFYSSLGWLRSPEVFYSNICNCPECRFIIGDNADNFTKYGETNDKKVMRKFGPVTLQFPTKETKISCLKHYLYRKSYEYDYVNQLPSQAEGLMELEGAIKVFGGISPSAVKHLIRWMKVLG